MREKHTRGHASAEQATDTKQQLHIIPDCLHTIIINIIIIIAHTVIKILAHDSNFC